MHFMAKREIVRDAISGKAVYYDKEITGKQNNSYILRVYDAEDDGNFLGNYKSEDEIKADLKDGSIFENVDFLESFIIDPMVVLEAWDPANYFEDYMSEAVALYEDYSVPTMKKNIGIRILEFIGKIIGLIVKAIKAVIGFIKKLFLMKILKS